MSTSSSRRVLFHYPVLNMGGAEKSSLRLMSALADRGWDVTLVVTTGGGALQARLDERIRTITLRPRESGKRFSTARGLAARLRALPDLVVHLVNVGLGEVRALGLLARRYDAAATLLLGTPTRLVRRRVRARQRLHFVRTDLSRVDPTGSLAESIRRNESETDVYVCVSEVARRSLVEAVPETTAKARVIHNILDADTMRRHMGEGPLPFPIDADGPVRLLTVCRLSERSKALVRLTRVARRLVDQGHAFRWYVVGDGPDRRLLEAAIQERGLRDYVRLLGGLDNPFPAYKAADVVVLTSYFEGLSGMVNEAKIAGRPVVATRVSGIEEQLVDGRNGLIVENDEDALVEGIRRLLTDPALRGRLTNDWLPPALLDDVAKLDRLEALLLGERA